jgi:hypothetical protein
MYSQLELLLEYEPLDRNKWLAMLETRAKGKISSRQILKAIDPGASYKPKSKKIVRPLHSCGPINVS